MKNRKDVKDKKKTIIASENEIKTIKKYAKKNKISFSRFVIEQAINKILEEQCNI